MGGCKMAKINGFLAEYKDALIKTGLPSNGGVPTKIVLRRFLRLFRNVDDSRLNGMINYPLEEIILITFLAVLGNAATWVEIETFGNAKEKWLKKIMKLKNGIPSHDTFRRVFSLLDTFQLQEVTVAFLLENLAAIKKALKIKDEGLRQICIDGKEQKGTGRKYNYDEKIRNLQTLHVYDTSNEICLYSKAINEKTNEIPVAQKILASMNLKNCIVTFDALHTQKKTIAIIVRQKGDYVGGLKGNQGTLQEDAKELFTPKRLASIRGTNAYYKTSEKAHGKLEVRRYYLAKANHFSNGEVEWQNLRNFICYEKYTCDVIDGSESTETRYYITSSKDIEISARAIRGHWGVENKLHWHLDYSFMEDMNTNLDKSAFNNLSLINKMVLSLCKLAQPIMKNKSIRVIRKEFAWEYEKTLAELLTCFDAEAISKALENKKK
jgi:predicted transposase YbfD/YdcC